MENKLSTILPRFGARSAADMLGVDVTTLYGLVRARKIEHFRIGNRYEFTEESIRSFIEAARQAPWSQVRRCSLERE